MRIEKMMLVILAILMAFPIMGITQGDDETIAGFTVARVFDNPSDKPVIPGTFDGDVLGNTQDTKPSTGTAKKSTGQKTSQKKNGVPKSTAVSPKRVSAPQYFSNGSHMAIYRELKTWGLVSKSFVENYVQNQLKKFGQEADKRYQKNGSGAAPSGYSPATYNEVISDYPTEQAQIATPVQYEYTGEHSRRRIGTKTIIILAVILTIIAFLWHEYRKSKNLSSIGFFWNLKQTLLSKYDLRVEVEEGIFNLTQNKGSWKTPNLLGFWFKLKPFCWKNGDKLRVLISIKNFSDSEIETDSLENLVSRICQQIMIKGGKLVPGSTTLWIGSKQIDTLKSPLEVKISNGEEFSLDEIIDMLPDGDKDEPSVVSIKIDFQMKMIGKKKVLSPDQVEESKSASKNSGKPSPNVVEETKKESKAQVKLHDNVIPDALPEPDQQDLNDQSKPAPSTDVDDITDIISQSKI